MLIESGGDNLAGIDLLSVIANYSRELADYIIYVIDVSGGKDLLTSNNIIGDKIPRKGGPGITQSDLLVINKARGWS